MSPNTEENLAPVHGLPNEFQAIQSAMLARWHDLGWAGVCKLEPFTFEETADGIIEACSAIDIVDDHFNPGGIVHGGVTFSLIDTAMGAIVFHSMRQPEMIATQSQTIDFLAPPTNRMTTKARIDKRGKTSAYVSGEAYDADGTLVARSTSVWAIRARKH